MPGLCPGPAKGTFEKVPLETPKPLTNQHGESPEAKHPLIGAIHFIEGS